MPTLVRISEEAISTSSLFSETSDLLFEIHPPQRRFKWKKQQIDQLWQDITNAYNAERDSYFLGMLLLVQSNDSGTVSVIDGQQRITTISILLAVLRDHCKEFEDLSTRADGIQRLIGRVDNDGKPVGSLVVTLQDPDNQIYKELVKEPGSTIDTSSPQSLLARAVKTLTEHVEQHINVPNREDALRGLCEYVQSKVKFLPLQVRSEGEGYLVFDTTNTRGLRPSPSESLKARLAAIARDDRDLADELINTWNGAATKLENAGQSIDAMDNYIHAVWCSSKGYTPKRTLDRIASKLATPNSLSAFVKDLESYCDSYLAVVAPSGKSSLSEDLKDLNALNVQSHSFLMTVRKTSPDRFDEAVDLVLSLQIRNVTVGPDQANQYEKDWPRWAVLVREGQTDEAFMEMRERMVSDEEFQQQFEKEEVASSRTVRHLLRRLDPISQPGSGVQPVEVDVEHILPKSLVTKLMDGKNLTTNTKRWIEDLGYELPSTRKQMRDLGTKLKPFTNMLGNQALLNDKANRGARDRHFEKKKDFYKKQALELTKSLASYEQWGLDQILANQRDMAKRAPQIWRKEAI